jgi:hypothetical protein
MQLVEQEGLQLIKRRFVNYRFFVSIYRPFGTAAVPL